MAEFICSFINKKDVLLGRRTLPSVPRIGEKIIFNHLYRIVDVVYSYFTQIPGRMDVSIIVEHEPVSEESVDCSPDLVGKWIAYKVKGNNAIMHGQVVDYTPGWYVEVKKKRDKINMVEPSNIVKIFNSKEECYAYNGDESNKQADICWLCGNEDNINQVVCYLPADNGGATDIPLRHCPICGRQLEED